MQTGNERPAALLVPLRHNRNIMEKESFLAAAEIPQTPLESVAFIPFESTSRFAVRADWGKLENVRLILI